ncbi:MAG TPA: hypothetical protein PK090_02240 [Smithellaceae bacterium]|nr:hypothetical protein [Smithellaceae bacterium]
MKKKDHEGTLINCFFCEHFYITYEAKFPYGCKAMGFKSMRMPSVDVYGSSGEDCKLYVRKERGHSHHD